MRIGWKKGVGAGAALLVLIQLVPVSRTNPPVKYEVAAPAEVEAILKRACYDCHSNLTDWPWYSYVAPISWWVAGHVNEGRGDLNFTEWPALDEELRSLALKDLEAEVAEGKMPLRSYALGHPEARLSEQDRQVLVTWARDR